LKVIPLYYFVFFAGWLVLPLVSKSINWFVADRMFLGCEQTWPYVLTFVHNYFPYFTKALEGCFYWPYVVTNEMQLFLFFPIWITLYRIRKSVLLVVIFILQLIGIGTNAYISLKYNLTIGILTFEDFYLYSYQLNKTHTKGSTVSMGLLLGVIYLRLLEYRKATYEEKKTFFRWMHIFHYSKIVTLLLYLYAIGMLVFITGIPRSANANGYSWTKTQNTVYNSLGRPAYLSAIMCWCLIIFMGKGNFIKNALSLPMWIALGKLTFGAYLVYPMVVGGRFYGTQTSFVVTYPTMVYAMISNIVVAFLIALPLYLFIQAPAANVVRTTVRLFKNTKNQEPKAVEFRESVIAETEKQHLLEEDQDDLIENKEFKLKLKTDM